MRFDSWQDFRKSNTTSDPNCHLCYLNTLLSFDDQQGIEKIADFFTCLADNGWCKISWSCTVFSRARWQTKAEADFIRHNFPKLLVEEDIEEIFVLNPHFDFN